MFREAFCTQAMSWISQLERVNGQGKLPPLIRRE
jgi:hypothetical protein